MKYYYYKDKRGNVGDDLNEVLLPKLFQVEDKNPSTVLVGVGTLINDKLPVSDSYALFTSGYGYQKPPKFENKKVIPIGLRGPMTFEKVKKYFDTELSKIPLIDGAYLITEHINGVQSEKSKIGIIPHVDSISIGLWSEVAKVAGFSLIDPRLSPQDFINQLTSCEFIVTEAMHGAIIADAYRVPWVPYYAYEHINLVKWSDWADSLGIRLTMTKSTPTFNGSPELSLNEKIKNTVKRSADFFKLASADWTKPPPLKSSNRVIEIAANELISITNLGAYQLSCENTVAQKLDHLKNNIDLFNRNSVL